MHKMFRCWKDSSRDVMVVGLINCIALLWSTLCVPRAPIFLQSFAIQYLTSRLS